MFAATTKGSFLLTDAAKTCDILEEAANLAFEGRPGPVHIHVPEDLTHPNIKVQNYRDIRLNVAPVLPDPARVTDAATTVASALDSGKKLLALAGFGAIRSGAQTELTQFLERFHIPFATTMYGKRPISTDHPLSA